MAVRKPERLKQGDLIGIISPASTPDDLGRIERSVRYFESLGYNVTVGANVGKYYGYLAGTDEERIADLHTMFSDGRVKAIICLRGGYGTPRLLRKIDYSIIRRNPKIFCGYSDITALQMAFFAKAGLVTFAGPMAAVDFHGEINRYTEEIFWRMITSAKKFGKAMLTGAEESIMPDRVSAEGTLLGGNLALITAITGTPFLPVKNGSVWMFEDVGEPPYRIDRMLCQLELSGVIAGAAAIVLGQFEDCGEPDPAKRTLSLADVWQRYLTRLDKPVVVSFPHGHIRANHTLPIGTRVKVIAGRKPAVDFLEPAVI